MDFNDVKNKPKNQEFFLVSPELSFAQVGKVPERTTFQGVAYSGEEITEMVLGFDIF
ncbi:MAG: hypothetical protein LBS60_07280 [Deltaproteobacteria bacterium]|jgi:hypothetical protein|nr:hypothetical protein [Deltaproteobacteria bacterium]